MDDPILIKLVWLVAAVIVYGLLRWRLMASTHAYRVRVGFDASELAHDPAVDPADRRALVSLAERAYRPATPWLLAGTLLYAVLSPNLTRRLPAKEPSAGEREGRVPRMREINAASMSREDVQQLNLRLFWALISTSPLASLLALLTLLAAALLRQSVEVVRDGVTVAMAHLRARARVATA